MRATRVRSGFTLIELLVVIAIIAILASILFPVFAQARAKARQAACLSNMNQMAKGLMMYSQDYEGVMPPSQLPSTGANVSWPTMMHPYIKNEGVFACPGANDAPFTADKQYIAASSLRYTGVTDSKYGPAAFGNAGDGSTLGLQSVNRLSYGRNLIPTGGWQTAGFTGGDKSGFVTTGTTLSVHEAAIERPADTIHIVDAITGHATVDARGLGNSIRGIQQEIRTDRYPNATSSKVDYRHNGGFNVVWGDGHCKWKKWGSSTAAEWSIQDD